MKYTILVLSTVKTKETRASAGVHQMNYLTQGNWETGPEVYLFNLPIDKTCRPTAWCQKNCYGKKGNYARFKRGIALALEKRYELSLSDEFAETITKEIGRRKISLVRVHVTGDFYSDEYVRKWIRIAANCPQTLFRTTTKRRDLRAAILELHSLPNFNIRESLDPSRSEPAMGLPIAAIETLEIAADFFRCARDCRKCGYVCWRQKESSYCFPEI